MATVKIKLNFSHVLLTLVLSTWIASSVQIAIDNDIIGEPDIECLDQEIRVWIKTRKVFAGRIYAKGRADDPDCAKDDFAAQRTKKPHYDLNLGMCGMKSLRSFDPRGMYYGITLVVSFHPLFITKVDQAFHVKCFFEEANRGLTAELGVSMIPTTEVEARHGIPGCTYSIHRSSIDDLDAGRPAGAPIQFAKVGDKVLHQWHCDDQMFGVLINNCYVTDGVNKRAEVIDSRGCPVDPILITGIRYSEDMQRAYAESQVFKFADRPGVWFFCQIQMCMKKEGMCDGITPPACAGAPVSVGGGGRFTSSPLLGSEDSDGEGDGDESLFTSRPRKTKKKNKKTHHSVDEDVEEYTSEDYQQKETYQTKKPKHKRPVPEEEDGDEDYSNKAHSHSASNKSNRQRIPGYGLSTNPDYDLHAKEPVTVFGPGIAPGAGAAVSPNLSNTLVDLTEPKSSEKTASQIVSTEFETDDDLTTATVTPSTTLGAPLKEDLPKKDYVDYDSEATVPKSLTELLSNLPADELNANNLQKMFRDSVADRRALLQGFDMLIHQMGKDKTKGQDKGKSMPKPPSPESVEQRQLMQKRSGRMPGEKIDTMHVTWESQRMARDLPISTEATVASDADGPPMIAGQLLIYDLDETPPPTAEEEAERMALHRDCAISKQGLMVLSMSLGSVAFALVVVILALSVKLRKASKEDPLLSQFGSQKSYSKSSLTSNSSSSNYCTANVSTFRQGLPSKDSMLSQRRTT